MFIAQWVLEKFWEIGYVYHGGSLSHYLQGFIHPRWLFGISEPSKVVQPTFINHEKILEILKKNMKQPLLIMKI